MKPGDNRFDNIKSAFIAEYKRISYSLIGKTIDNSGYFNMERELIRARIPMSTGLFLGIDITTAILGFIFFFTLFLFIKSLVLAFLSASAMFLLIAGLFFVYPRIRIGSRKRKIDDVLPYAFSYMATLSSAGVSPLTIFESMAAEREVYSEMSREAEDIARDMKVFGMDMVNALLKAANRSPSPKLQSHLQGINTSIIAGTDLSTILSETSERLMFERRFELKGFIDDMGLYAEFYVTLCVLAPLFIVMMLPITSAITALMGGTQSAMSAILGSSTTFLIVIYILMPLMSIMTLMFMDMVMPGDLKR